MLVSGVTVVSSIVYIYNELGHILDHGEVNLKFKWCLLWTFCHLTSEQAPYDAFSDYGW